MTKDPNQIAIDQLSYANSDVSKQISAPSNVLEINSPRVEYHRPIVNASRLINGLITDMLENDYGCESFVIGGGGAEVLHGTLEQTVDLIIYVDTELYRKASRQFSLRSKTFKDWFIDDGITLVPYMQVGNFELGDVDIVKFDNFEFRVLRPSELLKFNETEFTVKNNISNVGPYQLTERLGMEKRLRDGNLI